MFFPGAVTLHHQAEPHKLRRQPTTSPVTMMVWQPRHNRIPVRKRKVQPVRLGGTKPPRRGMLRRLVRIFGRMRVKWLKLQYVRLLMRLKEHYRNILKELVEAGATIETMLFTESTTLIPAGGITISSCPSRYGSEGSRAEKLLYGKRYNKITEDDLKMFRS